ncbi:phosphoserine phosphatase [Chryseotalea sanaruensis]|uniref:Phosphoserine phosphatase n=1 Tax=Chryseotalea sanaruensis TaxID=2482724 RepID=A0A401U9V8_9BACT|nr:PP2C family protein-serine/threonine phosphatase [Chryseotalea sanaruensis]GCC51698.1 phosphoserine phosphatase [Chryseotalea sanaruensis]
MLDLPLQHKFDRKNLELNALLEVTQSINANKTEDELYKIFNFTVRANLQVKKLALFVFDEIWSCKVNYGTTKSLNKCKLPLIFHKETGIRRIVDFNEPEFTEFEMLIPVVHKTEVLALVFVGGLETHNLDFEDGLKFLQALSNITIVAIENKKLARKQLEREAYRKELEIASDVQQFLFPEKLPNTERLKMEASYLPHDMVGGDYYDFIPINKNQFLICVADVSGKGVAAALMMSNFQASLRTLLRQTPNLREIVEALNFQVMENAKGEKFITFFGAIYDLELKTLVYINAGHNPPILIKSSGEQVLLEEGCIVLGALPELPFINEGFITGLNDFLLFCYTDGVTETSSENGEDFGQESLLKYFSKKENVLKNLSTIHQDLIVALDTHKGRNAYHDDITMLSCRVS